MSDSGALASIDTAVAKVISDLVRARSILSDAMSRLVTTFTGLRDQLIQERALFEHALAEVNGTEDNSGLVGVLRNVLSRTVEDMVRIGTSSVKIMVEVEALRLHTQQVASSGLKIEQIATTTRMLSLNARIEAQRIGSNGAVFRVVADEIKALAVQSGDLSKAIREALAVQSAALGNTSAAVSLLAASDLDHAVASHKHLDEAIVKLAKLSSSALQILDRIQHEADAAIQALQFEDMLSQLLQSTIDKLELVRNVCRDGGDNVAELERRVFKDTVTQQSVSAGSVELF